MKETTLENLGVDRRTTLKLTLLTTGNSGGL
jgi:hypothetical protein